MSQEIKFTDLNLSPHILKALIETGYEVPTEIQKSAIPSILQGKDLLGIAQTGTGKTAAFCLPLINNLSLNQKPSVRKSPRALILTPTRELAIQIFQNLVNYGKYLNQKYAVIYGGVGQNAQVRDISSGLDVLVATPGRLLDLIGQGFLRLNQIEIFVLDEADRMLDMGFMRDIQRILPLLPKQRHNLFFSATMPAPIQKLAQTILVKPQIVEVTPPATTVERINQAVMFVDKKDKLDLLIHLLQSKKNHKSLVFVEMKHVANRISEKLAAHGIKCAAIHGNKTQSARQKAIADFTYDRVEVLVATDIASRGIDIDGITQVINYELSNVAENYVHRIGRTARAGKDGEATSLVTAEEKSYLENIIRVTKSKIEVIKDHPYHSDQAASSRVMSVGKAKAMIEGQRKNQFGRRVFR
jgi:ATP-dependent RNA helicase RhlE